MWSQTSKQTHITERAQITLDAAREKPYRYPIHKSALWYPAPSLTVRALFHFQTQQEAGGTSGLNWHMGRPSEYSAETAERICELLAKGKSLRQVCKASDMPDRNTVMRWMEAQPDFAAKYARARDIGLDERADKLLEEIKLEPDVAKARLLLDHGKWYLSKLAPRKYGDKLAIDGDGEGGAIPIALKVQFE